MNPKYQTLASLDHFWEIKTRQTQIGLLEHSKFPFDINSLTFHYQILINRVNFIFNGYMPPKYATRGHFSVKSDVFSYDVIVLEIISGKKNMEISNSDNFNNLPGHVSILILLCC